MEELIKQGKKSKFICGKREIVNHILRTFYQFSGFTCKDLSFVPWLDDYTTKKILVMKLTSLGVFLLVQLLAGLTSQCLRVV